MGRGLGRLDVSTCSGHIFLQEQTKRNAMAGSPRQSWVARLLVVMLALALVAASTAGAIGHANGSGHHGPHGHHHQAMAPAASAGAHHAIDAQSRATDLANAATQAPQPDPQHASCMDHICHCCLGLVAIGAGWGPAAWPDARVLPWDSRALVSAPTARLDRPPKPLASA
jgi:hypothetical protein